MKTILGTMILAMSVGATALSQPQIQIIEGTRLELGSMYRGEVRQKEVTISNVGSEVLLVGAIDASCGCTGTMISTKEIQPGKSGSLLITFNSKNFTGKVHKTVTIYSNARNQSATRIEFSADVIEEVSVTPAQFFFRDAETGRKSTAFITVTNSGSAPLHLKGYRSQLEGLTLKLPDQPIKPGEAAQVTAEYTPTQAVPVLSNGVFIDTSSKHQSELYIYIFGKVREFRFE